jgi:ADP-heptose:LPS heptosyltransferase
MEKDQSNKDKQHKILVFTDGEIIGDGFIKLPFLKALRDAYPDSHIYWHTRGPSVYKTTLQPIAEAYIDTVLEKTSLPVLWQYKFDLIIDTQKVFLRTLRLKFLRHKKMVSGSSKYIFSSYKPKAGQTLPRHDLKRLIEMVSLAGKQLTLSKKHLPLSPDLRARASEILPGNTRYIGLNVGAGKPFKCWPLENFITLASILVTKDFIPVFILGPQELSWLQRIKQAIPEAIFPLQDAQALSSPLFTVAIGERLEAAISNDCGGGHMMSAAEIPLISLFGKTNADKVCPLVENGYILKAQDYGSDEMAAIPVEEVLRSLEQILANEPTKRPKKSGSSA